MSAEKRRHRIAIIIPVLNGERFVANAIDSALSQLRAPDEVVVLDNASSDGTPRILEAFRRYSNVRLHRNPVTLPAIAQWKRAVSLSSAELFSVLSADDLLAPEYTRVVTEVLTDHDDIGLFYCWSDAIDENGKIFGSNWRADSAVNGVVSRAAYLDAMVKGAFFYTCGVGIRRSAYEDVGGFDTRFEAAGDYDLFLRLGSRHGVYGHPDVLSSYRFHPKQHSAEMHYKSSKDFELLFRKIGEYGFDEVQQQAMVEFLCGSLHGHFFRWARRRQATISDVGAAREMAVQNLELLRNSGYPWSRFVQTLPRKATRRFMWSLSSGPAGIYAIRGAARLLSAYRSWTSSSETAWQ